MRASVEALVALRELGASLRRCKKARGQTVADMAKDFDLDPGDPGVSVGVLLAALDAHGLASRLRTMVPAPIIAPTPEEKALWETEFRS